MPFYWILPRRSTKCHINACCTNSITMGSGDTTLSWIESFLTGRKQHVLTEGAISSEAEVDSGVPQGTVMGPLLFLAFINDLPDVVSSPVRLFADDCLIYRSIKSSRDTTTLQQDLTALETWERDWQMAFHPEKCTTIHITRRKTASQSRLPSTRPHPRECSRRQILGRLHQSRPVMARSHQPDYRQS